MKNVARNNYVTTVCRSRAKVGNHFGTSQRIEAVHRLIQDQNSRAMTQRLRQPDALAHSFAIPCDVAPCRFDEIHPLNGPPGELLCRLGVGASKPEKRIDKLKSRQALGKGVELCAVP